MGDLGSAVGSIVLNFDPTGVNQATASLDSLQQKANAMSSVGANIAGLGAALGAPLIGAVKVAADFNQELANIASVGGKAAQASMQQISDTALQLGKDTAFSASQAAQGMEELIKAGVPVQDVLDGAAASALNLSAATGTAVPEAATVMATALNVFSDSMAGFSSEGEKATHIADLFAQVANASASDVRDLALGFEQSANVAKLFGLSVDDTATSLGILANAGLQSSDAGTSLKQMLISLANPSATANKALASIGLTAQDFFGPDGTFVGIPKEFDTLRQAMLDAGVPAGEVVGKLTAIFGTDAVRAAGVFFNTTDQGWADFTGNMDEAGTAAEQAQVRLNTFEGALEQFRGSVETLGIQIGTIFLPVLTEIVHGLTTLVNGFITANPQIQQFVAVFGGIAAVLLTATGGALLAAGHILRLIQVLNYAGVSVKALTASLGLLGLAIGAGILAYQTNFLGFADAVNGALAAVQKAASVFAKVFERVFNARTAKGIGFVAAAVDSFGVALEAATGLPVSDRLHQLSQAIRAVGDGFRAAMDAGFNPVASALIALANGFQSLGLDDVADVFDRVGVAVQRFGDVFERVFSRNQAAGVNAVSAGIEAFGAAFSKITGINVTGIFDRLAQGIQTGIDSFQQAINQGMNPFEAALIGVRAALSSIIGLDLRGLTDLLGSIGGTIRDVATAILSGDFTKAGQILGDAIQTLSTGLGDALAAINVGDIAQRVGDALGTALSTIGSFLTGIDWSGVVSSVGTFLTAAFSAIGTFLTTVAATVGGVLVTLLNTVGSFLGGIDFPGVLSFISTTLLKLMNVGGDWLGPIAATVGSAIVTALQNVGTFLGGLDVGAIVTAVGTALGTAFTTVGNFLGPLAASVGSAIVTALGNVASFLGGLDVNAVIEAVGAALGSAFPSIGNFLGPLAAQAGSAIVTALANVKDFLGGLDTPAILTAVGAALTDAFSGVVSVLGTIGALVGSGLVTVINGVGSFLGGISVSDVVSAVATAIGTAFTTIGSLLGTVAAIVGSAIVTALQSIGTFLGGLTVADAVAAVAAIIKTAFTTIGNALPGLAETVGNAIGAAVSTAGNFLGALDFSGVVSAVTSAITAAFGGGADPNGGGSFRGGGTGFSGIAASLGGALASALNSIGTFLEGFDAPAVVTAVVAKIQSAFDAGGVFDFSTLGTDIKTALEQACGVDLSGVFNALGKAVSVAALAFNNFQLLVTPALSSFVGLLKTIGEAGVTALFEAIGKSVSIAALAFNTFQLLVGPALTAFKNALPDLSVGDVFAAIGKAVSVAALAFNNFQLLMTPALTALKNGLSTIPTPDFSLITNALQLILDKVGEVITKVGELKDAFAGLTPDPTTVAAIDASIASRKQGDMGQGQPAAAPTAAVLPPITFDAAAIAAQIISDISSNLGAGTATLAAALGAVVSAAGQGITSAAAIGTKLITDIAGGLGPATGSLQAALNAVISTTIAAASATAAAASSVGTALDTATGTGIGASAALVTAAVQGMVGVVVSAGSTAAAAASAIGDAFDTAVGAGIGGSTGTPIGAASAMVGSAIAAGQGAAGGASAIGVAISSGAASGVNLHALDAAVAGMVNNGIAAGMAAAGAASPSRVAMTRIGEPIAEGAAIGIRNKAAIVSDAVSSMVNNAMGAGQAIVDKSPWASWLGGQTNATRDQIRLMRQQGRSGASEPFDLTSRLDLMHGGGLSNVDLADLVGRTRQDAINSRPLQIHIQSVLDGQVLDDRIVQTSIGAMTQVPQRGGHRNSRFSLAGA